VGLSIWWSSIRRQLHHFDDVEAEALKAAGNVFSLAYLGEGHEVISFSECGEKVKYWRLFFSR
jgi:hypothetical protein